MHQCLSCKKLYDDEEVPIIDGCMCGSRMFLFIKHPEDTERIKEVESELTEKIKKIDADVAKTGESKPKTKEFGIETIKEKQPGVYEINLKALMKGEPVIVLLKKGSYIINLPSAFSKGADVLLQSTN